MEAGEPREKKFKLELIGATDQGVISETKKTITITINRGTPEGGIQRDLLLGKIIFVHYFNIILHLTMLQFSFC